MSKEQAVHDQIMAILSTAGAPVVTFDASDGSAFVGMNVSATKTKFPRQAEAGVVSYVMRDKSDNTTLVGAYSAEIHFETWQAHVEYPTRVSVEGLAESLSRTIAASGTQRQFDLRLVDMSVEHPPRNDPSNGTFIVLSIQVHPVPA